MLPESAAPDAAVKVDISGRAAVIRLRGDLDITAVRMLLDKLAALTASRPEFLVLDMSEAGTVDYAAATVIVDAARSALPAGRKPVIGSPAPPVRRLLQLTGLAAYCRLGAGSPAGKPGVGEALPPASRPGDRGMPVTGRAAAVWPDIVPRARAARSAAEAACDRARQLREQAQHALARGEALYPVIEVALADRLLSRPPAARQHLLRRSQYARLVARLDTMPVIEQAKGIIMGQQQCGPDEAFDLLRRASQRSNVKVHVLAAQIVANTSGSPVTPGSSGQAASAPSPPQATPTRPGQASSPPGPSGPRRQKSR